MNKLYSIIYRVPGFGRPLTALLTSLLICVPAAAQEVVFEEIVVVAQKREQNIMDVPVAVSAVSGQQIDDAGIKDVFDLQQNVPGLIIGQSQTATTTNFSIRGVGTTSNNFGLESSVGLYVDGVYRSRQSSLINELIDVEAVEVLRGPQGTLFGKNTPSGAIQVRTVRPSQDLDAFIDVTAGDYSLARISAAANVPLTENLAFRGTIFSSHRDGYVDDALLGKELYNDRDRQGVRLQLGLNEAGDDFNMRLIVDYSEIDEVCCVGVSRVDGIYAHSNVPASPFDIATSAGSDYVLATFGGTIFTDFPYPDAVLNAPFLPNPTVPGFPALAGSIVTGVGFDDYIVAYNQPPQSENEDSGISLEINKNFANGLTFTSISAFRFFDTFDLIDADFTNVDILERINRAEVDSVSQEIRLAGEFGNNSNFVVGAYYFGQELKSFTDTNGGILLEPYVIAVEERVQLAIGGLNALSAATMGAIPPAAAPVPPGTFASDTVVQDQKGWAVFGQVDFSLGDNVIVTLGGRYTDEEKDIDAKYVQNASGPRPDFAAIGLNLFLASQGQAFDPTPLFAIAQPNDGWATYLYQPLGPRPDLTATLSDDQVTGTAKLSWFPSETSMLYLSYATGFKSGGTNADRIDPSFSQVFAAETSESIEVGFKGDVGPVRLALAYYQTDYDDFQVNSFTGTSFNVQNAGQIETDGFEVEALWRPFDTFQAQLIYTHTEGTYKSFERGTAWDANVFHTQTADPNCEGDLDASICPRTGGPISYSPEDRAFVALTKDFIVSNDTSMFIRGEYSYASEQFTDGDLDPLTRQDAFDIVNLRIGLNFDAANSTLTLWGRNITDERYYVGSFDAPLQAGRMNSYPAEPATYGITYRKAFD